MKGGATWAFESANIYNAVKELPSSDSAVLAGPRLSALGAWGDLRTTFDQRRSTIAASATMGRTHRYVLERIGRIGVWWNRAKHVIVSFDKAFHALMTDLTNEGNLDETLVVVAAASRAGKSTASRTKSPVAPPRTR